MKSKTKVHKKIRPFSEGITTGRGKMDSFPGRLTIREKQKLAKKKNGKLPKLPKLPTMKEVERMSLKEYRKLWPPYEKTEEGLQKLNKWTNKVLNVPGLVPPWFKKHELRYINKVIKDLKLRGKFIEKLRLKFSIKEPKLTQEEKRVIQYLSQIEPKIKVKEFLLGKEMKRLLEGEIWQIKKTMLAERNPRVPLGDNYHPSVGWY